MSDTNQPMSRDDAEPTHQVLAECLERFLESWGEGNEPPSLADFLPQSTAYRRVTLVELIKIDLELRWQERNLPKHVGDYLREFPELVEGGFPTDLVYEEYHIRKQCGFNVDPSEYAEQFPEQAEELLNLLGVGNPYKSTFVFGGAAARQLEEIEPGSELDDFDLLLRLGKGAFAQVFLARQRSMQRLVALKVSADSGAEPQTLAQLDHDYIVRVFDQRLLPERKLRLLYMQYAAGGTLQSVIELVRDTEASKRHAGLLPEAVSRALEEKGETRPAESSIAKQLDGLSWPETVCWMGSRLALGLDYAHGRGVLHRDIKPANVLLTNECIPKLADFNISFSSNLAGATPVAYFGGSLAYMSAEQLEAYNPAHPRTPDSLDARSDLYSLGIVLWELLTGELPFGEESFEGSWPKTLERMTARRKEKLSETTLQKLPADCPPGLIRVLQRCLAPVADDRWSSGEELAKQLDLCGERRVQELLHPPAGSWPVRIAPLAGVVIFLAAAIPNILAGIFNSVYNEAEIVANLKDASETFFQIRLLVNGVAYPLGLAIFAILVGTVIQAVRAEARGELVDIGRLRRLRKRALLLGQTAAVIGIVEWAVAGLVYPISVHLARGLLPPAAYVHFFASLLLCGLIAASYPFFGVTWIALRVWYPKLLRDDLGSGHDAATLNRVARLTWVYVVSAASVPLLGVLILSIAGEPSRFALVSLSLGGLVGFAVVLWSFRRLQEDLQALRDVAADVS